MTKFTPKLLFKKSLTLGFLVCSFWLLKPNSASATTVFLEPEFESVAVGDTVIVDVRMDTDGKIPNAIEGEITVDQNVEISRISTADSVLTIWPQSPSIFEGSLISFVGGTPDGFNHKSGLLFKIVFLAEQEGQVTFSPKNIIAYENDGKGTQINVNVSPLSLNIKPQTEEKSKNQWLKIITEDKNPPQNVTATFGQDSSIFEGKKIISISATDDQSGVDYFEVQEGDAPVVRSGDIYVLLDQSESSTILITAYDKAGNHSQISLKPVRAKTNYMVIIIISLLALTVLAGLIFLAIKRVKKKNKI